MMAIIAAAMQSACPQAAMANIGQYKSRGHGRGIYSGKKKGNRCHNIPHQGKKECARRVRQMQQGLI